MTNWLQKGYKRKTKNSLFFLQKMLDSAPGLCYTKGEDKERGTQK